MAKKDKRNDVLQATLEIIAENGFHNAPTSLIAERAGVGMGTIYRYFKSKDELIHAIYAERINAAREHLRADYDVSQPLKVRYLKLCRNLFNYMIENPLDYSFYEQYKNSPYGPESHLETLQGFSQSDSPGDYFFMQLLTEGQEMKAIKMLDFSILFALTMGPIMVLAGQSITGAIKLKNGELEEAFSACWDAIVR